MLLLFCVYLGLLFPLQLSFTTWLVLLVVYVFVAAASPVWILLQPRDYLNSFLLYMLIVGALIGIIFTSPAIKLEAYTSAHQNIGYIFPLLFVTVACGAISGFHSLVASGTTSKQLNTEKDAQVIGYGGMLIESLLAVLAIITAAALTRGEYSEQIRQGPVALFSHGVGQFIAHLGFAQNTGQTFAALAVSAFALTTLDTATRLGRFAFQEFFSTASDEKPTLLVSNRFIGTTITVGLGAALAFSGKWELIWPLFGSANQLLAAIALLAVSVWLAARGIRNGFTVLPMIFMFVVTISALSVIMWKNITTGHYLLAVFSIGLLAVALSLIALAIKQFVTNKHPVKIDQAKHS